MYVPRPGAVPVAPLMAGLGLGERPGAFKIKYDLRQMDVERRRETSFDLGHYSRREGGIFGGKSESNSVLRR